MWVPFFTKMTLRRWVGVLRLELHTPMTLSKPNLSTPRVRFSLGSRLLGLRIIIKAFQIFLYPHPLHDYRPTSKNQPRYISNFLSIFLCKYPSHIPPKINQDILVNFCQSFYAHIPLIESHNHKPPKINQDVSVIFNKIFSNLENKNW